MEEVLLWSVLSPEPTVLLLFYYYYLTSVWFQRDTKMLWVFSNDLKYLQFPPTVPSANTFSKEFLTAVTVLLGSP